MTQRTTVIGANMRVDGNLAGDGNVIVRGHFEGAVHIGGTLTVAAGAVVRADVVAVQVLVDGCLEGKVRVIGVVRVTSRGMLAADVEGELDIEAGGVHRGAHQGRAAVPRTHHSAEVPEEPEMVTTDRRGIPTTPSSNGALAAPPGATKASLRRDAPAPPIGQETVKWYGEAGLSRRNEPPRRESGPIDFAITTGELAAVRSDDRLPSAAPRAPWSPSQPETPTIPRRDPDGPLRLMAGDLVGDQPPPPHGGVDSEDSPLPLPGVGDGSDEADSTQGDTEPTIQRAPTRWTTSPGNSPVRRAFGQNTARHRLDGREESGK